MRWGDLNMYQHEPSSKDKNNGHARPTLDIELRAFYGDVSLSLPRSFRGPITIRTGDDRIAFSPAFAERVVLLSKVSLAGVRTYFVGDRPEGGKWGYGDTSDKTDDNLLDSITVYGKYTCTRINLDGEELVPTMGLNVWKSFRSGVERYFSRTRTRLTSSHDDGLSICLSLSIYLLSSPFDYVVGSCVLTFC
jgi:hypothetical protein